MVDERNEVGALEISLKGGKPWGFSIQGGLEARSPLSVSREGWFSPVISLSEEMIIERVAVGGKAEQDGRLEVGDLILSVNDVACRSKAEAVQLIDSAFKTLTLEVWRGNIRDQQRSEVAVRSGHLTSGVAKDDSAVYTSSRPQGTKMKRNESFSVGQQRPMRWQRPADMSTHTSVTIPADFPTYPSGSLSPQEENPSLLFTAPASLSQHSYSKFPQSKSVSSLDTASKGMHTAIYPRPYQGPNKYQSSSALNTAGLDNARKPGSTYEKLSNTGLDFSPKKQQNPKSEEMRNRFVSRENDQRQYSDDKNSTFQVHRPAHHVNYMNIPGVQEENPPVVPPLPKLEHLAVPQPPERNSSRRHHGKFPSWPVEGSSAESKSEPISTPPVRDYNNTVNSAAPYQPGLHTVKETQSPLVERKDEQNLMNAKQPDVYQARRAKVIPTHHEEDPLRNLLSSSRKGYPPPTVDSQGNKIGDQDYTVPSPPERDEPTPKVVDLLKKFSKQEEQAGGSSKMPVQRFNQRNFDNQRLPSQSVRVSASTQSDQSVPRSPESVVLTRPQLQLPSVGMSTQTPAPPRLGVVTDSVQTQNTMTQTSPQGVTRAPWETQPLTNDVKSYKESAAQVTPPIGALSEPFGLNSLLSDKDAASIIGRWELESERRKQSQQVTSESTPSSVADISGHLSQYSLNTAPMLHRLSNDVSIQQQLQKVSHVAPSADKPEHLGKNRRNHRTGPDEAVLPQANENEPIYATIEDHRQRSMSNWKGVRNSLKDIASQSNYVNMYPPNTNNYMNIEVEGSPHQTHSETVYTKMISREGGEQRDNERSNRGYGQEVPVSHGDNSHMLKTWHGYSNSYGNPKPEVDLYRIEEHERHSSEGQAKDVSRLRYEPKRQPDSKPLKRTTSEQIRPVGWDNSSHQVPNTERRHGENHVRHSSVDQRDYRRQPIVRNMEEFDPNIGRQSSRKSRRSDSYREFEVRPDNTRLEKKRQSSSNFDRDNINPRPSMGSSTSSESDLKKLQKDAVFSFYQAKTEGSTLSLPTSEDAATGHEGSLQRSRPSSLSKDGRQVASTSQLPHQVLRRSDSVASSQSHSGSTSSGGYSPNRMSWDRGEVFRPPSMSSMEKSPLSPSQHPQSAMEMNVSGLLSPDELNTQHRRSSSGAVFEATPTGVSGSKGQYKTSHTHLAADQEGPPLPPRNYRPSDDRAPQDMRRSDPNWEQRNDWHQFNLWRKTETQPGSRYDQKWLVADGKQSHDHNRNQSQGKSYENIYASPEDEGYTQELRNRARKMSQNHQLSAPANYKKEPVVNQAKLEVSWSKPVDTAPQPQETCQPPPRDTQEPVRPPKTYTSPLAKGNPVDSRMYNPVLPPHPIEETDIDAVIIGDESLPPPPLPKDYPTHTPPAGFHSNSPRSSPSIGRLSPHFRSSPKDFPAEISFPPPPPTNDVKETGSQTDEDEIDSYPENSYMAHSNKLKRNRCSPVSYGKTSTSERPLLSTAPADLESAVKPAVGQISDSVRSQSSDSTRSQSSDSAHRTKSPLSSNEHSPRNSPPSTCAVQLLKCPRPTTHTTANSSYSQLPATPDHVSSPQLHEDVKLFKPIHDNIVQNLPPKGHRRYSEQPYVNRSPAETGHGRRQSVEHTILPRRSNDVLDKPQSVASRRMISESTDSLEGAFVSKVNEDVLKSAETVNAVKLSREEVSEKESTNCNNGPSPVVSDKPDSVEPALTIKHIRQKSQEELECDQEAARLANQIKEKDGKLSKVLLSSDSQKTVSDYMEGVVEIDPAIQHRRQSSAGKSSSSPKSTSPRPPSDGRNSMTPEKLSDSPHPVSPYWNPTPSSQSTCFVDELNDSGDLHKKKEELAERIQKKLDCLLQQKKLLKQEADELEELGVKVSSVVESKCTKAEFEKYNLYIDESQKVVLLLLKLSGWLANAENQLTSLSEDAPKAVKDELLEKKDKYAKQHEDARGLKEGIDRRRARVHSFLENYLSDQQFEDFKHFTKTRLTLIWEIKDLDDSIQMGQDQLKELHRSMELSP